MTNTKALKAAIVNNGYTQKQVAKNIGISSTSFNYKLNNKREFLASEIAKLKTLLKIEQVDEIFFADYVSKTDIKQ